MILRNAQLLHLDPPRVERGELRVVGESLVEPGGGPEEPVLDLEGAWVLPGLVCGHTHLYSALSCGMPLPATPPARFSEMLAQVWWRLDRALDRESIEVSAAVGGIAALRAGVTTLFDHHASPNFIEGSLEVLDGPLDALGLRRVLCYEITDRGGPTQARAGLAAHHELLASPSHWRAGLVGAHASFTLSDETLTAAAGMARDAGVGLHIHVAEALDDRATTGEPLIGRLGRLGALLPDSVLAHCVHLDSEELARVADAGAWVSHQPRSNMNNAVGHAPLAAFGDRTMLGTDGIGADMLAELQVGWLRAQEDGAPWSPARWTRALATGATLAGRLLGLPLGRLVPGAAADLVVLDPVPGPPLSAESLAAALIYRMSAAQVRHVMVGGRWRLWDHQPTGLDAAEVDRRACTVAPALWQRMESLA